MKKALFIVFIFTSFLVQSTPLAAESPEDILVIANRALSVSRVTESELKNIFLYKKSSWNTGLRAVPIHSNNASLRDDFRNRLLKMNKSEETRFWQQYQIKTGKPQPPSFGNTLKAVYKIKGAVSYIYRSQYKEGVVNVVSVLAAPQQ